MDKILKVDDIKNMSSESLLEAFRNGYRIEEVKTVVKSSGCSSCSKKLEEKTSSKSSLLLSMASCPTTSIAVGKTIRMTASVSGGTAPYTLKFLVGNVLKGTKTLASAGSTYFDYIIQNTDYGSITCAVNVNDSCPSGAKLATSYCNINVSQQTLRTIEVGINVPQSGCYVTVYKNNIRMNDTRYRSFYDALDGDSIRLVATWVAGYAFKSWSVNGVPTYYTNPHEFNVAGDYKFIGNFEASCLDNLATNLTIAVL